MAANACFTWCVCKTALVFAIYLDIFFIVICKWFIIYIDLLFTILIFKLIVVCCLQVVSSHELPTWLSSLAVADVDQDGQDEVVVGCHDNSIHGLKISVA